ncbi:transposase, partial [Salmonella enterica]|uniref:transposase n=1 Tax=Salmonella enterica TaxID=28901 RepID=UPI0034A2828F
ERIPAAAGIVNLRYKSCPEMAGQDHLKFKYRNREFWCRGYYVDTVGKNTAKIQDYIKHQLEEDKMGEQLSIPYPGSPFTGRK